MSRGDAAAGASDGIGPARPLWAQTMRGPTSRTRSRKAAPRSSSRYQPPVGPPGGSQSVYTFQPAGRSCGGPRGHPIELVGSRVRVDDRVGEHAAGAGVAVDHLAGGGDVGVVDHRVALEARRRREEGDRGLAAGEHAGGPGGGRQVVGVDRVAPALGLHHPEEAHERGGAGGGVAARADEVRLHVDHRPERREALVGGRRVDLRLGGDVEEPAAVLGVEGPQRGGRADPVAQVLGRRQVETRRVPVGQVDRAVQGPLLPRPGRHRCVLVGGPGRQQRDVDGAEPTEQLEHRLQPGGEVESLVERGVPVPGAVEVVALEPREDVDVEVPQILVARRLVVLTGRRPVAGEAPP